MAPLALLDEAPGTDVPGASVEDRLAAMEAQLKRIEAAVLALGSDAHALAQAASTVTAKLSGGGGIMSLLMGK